MDSNETKQDFSGETQVTLYPEAQQIDASTPLEPQNTEDVEVVYVNRKEAVSAVSSDSPLERYSYEDQDYSTKQYKKDRLSKEFGTASLVCGIIAVATIPCSCCCIVTVPVGTILAIIAIVLGICSKDSTNTINGNGKAGIIFGIIALFLCLCYFLLQLLQISGAVLPEILQQSV